MLTPTPRTLVVIDDVENELYVHKSVSSSHIVMERSRFTDSPSAQPTLLKPQSHAHDLEQELGHCIESLNQFWFSGATIAVLKRVIEAHGLDSRVAFMSTPSLFFAVSKDVRRNSVLLEVRLRMHSGLGLEHCLCQY